MMENLLRRGMSAWRRIAGEHTLVERVFRKLYRFLRSRAEKKYAGPDFSVFWASSRRSRRVGIFVRGSCDLGSMFLCQPLIQPRLNGTCCIKFEGTVWDSASPLILQKLNDFPENIVRPVIDKLKLPQDYFQRGQLFERTMTVKGIMGHEIFPKDIIVMSIGPDVIRTLYRHREHGFYVDPGGWWFNQGMTNVLSDLSVANWFRKHFESVGRIAVEDFSDNFRKIVGQLRERTGAHVMVYNMLSIEPGSQLHNYQLVKNSIVKRAREFNLCLVELSRTLDIAIVDVDRALKRQGVSGQIDYAHFPPALYPAVADEANRIMKDLKVI